MSELDLITSKEAAALARVSLRTFNRSIARHLTKVRPTPTTTRYRRRDVIEYLEQRAAAPITAPKPAQRKSNVERAIAANPTAARLLRTLEGKNAA